MFFRVPRYFPAFFAILSTVLLLLIPYYYVDYWSSSTDQLKIDAENGSSPERPPPVDSRGHPGRFYPIVKPQSFARLDNQIMDDSAMMEPPTSRDVPLFPALRFGGPLRPPPLPGAMPFRMGGGGPGYGPGPLHPNAAEFALQMTKDRLRIERYGIGDRLKVGGLLASGNWTASGPTSAAGVNGTSTPRPLQVIVVTYFRAGTTFFGDLLNQYPGTFYHFEPLHKISRNGQVETEDQVAESIDLLRHLLRCEYESLSEYLEWVRDPDRRFLMEHNRRLWFACQFQPALCFDAKFLGAMCRLHPVHVVKLVRMRLAHVARLLREFPQLHVIYMARDPRGIYSSRRDLSWCNGTRSCIEPEVFCAHMRKDLAMAVQLKSAFPDRFQALRYEDLALDTENQMKHVLDSLHLRYGPKLQRFIESHTKPRPGYPALTEGENPYSTKRNSKKTVFSWRRKLSPQEVDYVTESCSDVIKQLALPQ